MVSNYKGPTFAGSPRSDLGIEIRRTVKSSPVLPFARIARKLLGTHYYLSLVICGDELAKRVNKQYRKKSYSPNVLSFPLGKNEGEIFLNVRAGAREAKKFGVPLQERIALLFIHGCLHLKGLRHGRTMDTTEQKTLHDFRIVK